MFQLQKGDKVGIISPSGEIKNKDLSPALNYLKNQGLIPVIGKHAESQYRYMGGTDKERASDIMDFFADKEIKALFCTRGSAGSIRCLPYLDYETIRKNTKPVFGFSDTTALQNGIYSQTDNTSYSGFLLIYDFLHGNINSMQAEDLHNIITGNTISITSGETVINGCCEGTLIGGNFYAFMSLCGSPYFPDLNNKIILLEDIGIKSYQFDIMLQQLSMQNGFDNIKGLIFGQYENIRIVDEYDGTIDDNINYFCQNLNIPIIKNFDYGHIPARHILPIGKKIHLDASHCTIVY